MVRLLASLTIRATPIEQELLVRGLTEMSEMGEVSFVALEHTT